MATDRLTLAIPRSTRRARMGVALLLGAAALAPAARADLWVKEKITGPDGKPLGERIWIQAADKVRMDEGETGFVLDAANGRGWIYGPGVGGCLALPAPGTSASSAPPEPPTSDQAKLDGALGLLGTGATLVQRLETKKIAGFDAQRSDVTKDGVAIEERWYASDLADDAYGAIVLRLMTSGQHGMQLVQGVGAIAFQSVGRGYPVRRKNLKTGLLFEAVEVRQTKQPASAFSPPPACAGR